MSCLISVTDLESPVIQKIGRALGGGGGERIYIFGYIINMLILTVLAIEVAI